VAPFGRVHEIEAAEVGILGVREGIALAAPRLTLVVAWRVLVAGQGRGTFRVAAGRTREVAHLARLLEGRPAVEGLGLRTRGVPEAFRSVGAL